MPLRRDLFGFCETLDFCAIGAVGKCAAVAGNNHGDKETAGQVAEEGEGPVHEHSCQAEAALEDWDYGELR